MNDDLQLIEQAIGGDSAAYGQLVRRYQDRLFTSLVHVVSNREEAEDVVQDTFVQAMLKLNSFRRDSSFYTWLYRIAINTAFYRHRQRRKEPSVDAVRAMTGNDPPDPGDDPADRMLREERATDIQRALSRLTEEFRLVLVMRDVDGFDYQSIARILDVSIGTVRSRLHRARSFMREQLRHHHLGSRTK
ncbi:MAG: sigma-70 family RNA polymerase sigma factor [Pirellulaceae bacterium]